MSGRSVRLGFIGVGYIAQQHLSHLVTDPAAQVVGLCDIDVDLAQATRAAVFATVAPNTAPAGLESLAGAQLYTDPAQLFQQQELDAVYVCLPPYAHGEAELAAVEAGVAMFVEKPVTLDLTLAQRIADGLRQRGLVGAAGYQSRYSDVVRFLQDSVRDRTVGMTIANRFTRLPSKSWYRFQSQSGGQVVEMATHQVDLLRCVVGEISTVYAAAGRRIVTSDKSEIFDVQAASLTFTNGAVGSLVSNVISGHGTPAHARGIHIFAEGRTLSLLGHEGESRTVQTVDESGRSERVFTDSSMREQARAFVRAVRDNRPELVKSSYDNGIGTLAVTLALQRSGDLRRPVRIAELLKEAAATSTDVSAQS